MWKNSNNKYNTKVKRNKDDRFVVHELYKNDNGVEQNRRACKEGFCTQNSNNNIFTSYKTAQEHANLVLLKYEIFK